MFINWSPIRKLIWLKASGAIVPDLPWKTITGNPLSFIARTAHALKSCVVGIEPVQSGSGDPSPDNVRPISGFTGANVYVDSEYDPTADPTVSVTWNTEAGTVYGGSLDVTTGVLTVTHRLFVADGVNIKTSGGYGASGANWLPAIVLATQDYGAQEVTSDDNLKSNYLKSSTGIQSAQNTIAFGNNGKIIVLHIGTMQGTDGTHGYNSANEVHAAVNAYLADHNLQVWYKLEAPNTYQLTPQDVSAIVGENNMWTDCATLTVEAKAL